MANIKQTNDPTGDGGNESSLAQRHPASGRILSHAELSNVMGRARRMQARTIANLFANLGKK